MKRFSNTIRNIFLVSVPACIFLLFVLEFFFRFVIPAAEIPFGYFDNTYQIHRFDPDGPAEGIRTYGLTAHHRIKWEVNNAGWMSSVDYFPKSGRKEKKLIALIGDSYIEGMTVNSSEMFPAQLRSLLPDTIALYSFGKAFYPLPQYLHVARYVKKEFQPDIMIFSVVHNDFPECWRDYRPFYNFLQLDDGKGEITELPIVPFRLPWWRKILRRSAFARYVIVNAEIQYRISALNYRTQEHEPEINIDVDVTRSLAQLDRIERGVDYVIGKIREENPDTEILFVLDGLRQDIYKGTPASSKLAPFTEFLKQACAKYKCQFLDMSPVFERHYEEHGERFNYDFDIHWNPLGNRLVAKAVYEKLSGSGMIGDVETDFDR